jgi:hypothetical protein
VRSRAGTFALLTSAGSSDIYLTNGEDAPLHAAHFNTGSLAEAIQLGDQMLFWIGASGNIELWKTPYAADVAVKVMDQQSFFVPVVYGNKVYGVSKVTSSSQDTALWETDGTAAGTKQVFAPTGANSTTGFVLDYVLLSTSGGLYFTGVDRTRSGSFVYRSDGTTAGTTEVLPYALNSNRDPMALAVVGNFLYFGFAWGNEQGLARIPLAGGPAEYIATDCALYYTLAAGNHLVAKCAAGKLRILKNAG